MKLWGGRFAKGTDRSVEAFTASLSFDRRLYRQDIAGSIAHCRMLARQGIIAAAEADRIVQGLQEVRGEIERGEFVFRTEQEDIHMAIEARLREKLGEVAGKLHTARSRNDQVALDLRLYLKETTVETRRRLGVLQAVLLDQARRHLDTILPGYTHLQRAQPVLLAHHLLAYFEMFERDLDRFEDCLRRTDVLPLGSGALAGVPHHIDREFVARELGFDRWSRNSLDAVSDRDFVVEYLAAASLAMMHLSRLAEEIILWSAAEFGFVELDDAYATGSSLMPQKKNPDVAELTRGKTGRVYGHLMSLLTLLKGLPLSYNRDLQEDKEALFDAIDTLHSCLEVMAGLLATMRVRGDRMRAVAGESFTLATDVADYLVRAGVPFRDAHGAVGALVRYALEQGKDLSQLSLEEYRRFSPHFGEDVLALTVEAAVAARDVPGGTARPQVERALAEAERVLAGRSLSGDPDGDAAAGPAAP